MVVSTIAFGDRYRSCSLRDGAFGRRHYTIVYAIEAPLADRIKFGKTANVEKRFCTLQGASPVPLKLLGHHWLPDDAEAEIFGFLKDDRVHGEWFNSTLPVKSVAALIAAKKDRELAEVLGMLNWLS